MEAANAADGVEGDAADTPGQFSAPPAPLVPLRVASDSPLTRQHPSS